MSTPKCTKLDPNWVPKNYKIYRMALKYGVSQDEFNQQFRQFRFFYGPPGETLFDWEAGWNYWFGGYCQSREQSDN